MLGVVIIVSKKYTYAVVRESDKVNIAATSRTENGKY